MTTGHRQGFGNNVDRIVVWQFRAAAEQTTAPPAQYLRQHLGIVGSIDRIPIQRCLQRLFYPE